MATQVINQVTSSNNGNFDAGVGAFDPAKIRGIFLVRRGQDLVATASLATASALQTAIQAKLDNNTYTSRAFFIHELIAPENNGEAVTYETREQLKYKSDKGTWDMIFTINGTYSQHIQLKDLVAGKARSYDVIFVDENNVIFHLVSSTGIKGMTLHALEVLPRTEPVSGTAVRYQLRVALKNIDDYDSHKHTELGFNPFTALTGVEQVVLTAIGSSGNGVHEVTLRSPDSQENYVELYKATGELKQAGAWTVTNQDGDVIAVTAVNLVLDGTEAVQFSLVLDQTDYTNGDTGYIRLSSVTTIKGYLSNALESNVITVALVK